MMKTMIRAGFSAALLLVSSAAFAADAPYSLEARGIVAVAPDNVRLPPCDDPSLFTRIASAFEDKESEYWNSDLELVSFADPVELAYRPWGPEFIPRRFCVARTQSSDGVAREIYYSVGYKTGTLGVAHGVEWCVTGLDRNLAYSPACKMAGP